MNTELKKNTEKWMQLERMTDKQRKIAESFYDDNLMSLIEEDFVTRNSDAVFESVEYLVASVGTSYEPIVLNIKLLKPGHILFLYTEKSEKTLNKVVEYCGLKALDYEKARVNETDPLDMYREIKKAYLIWNNPEKMYIDISGGTKAMSATAALAGAMIDVQLIYVASNDYLVDFRKPNPGSEELIYIDNPMAIFGDIEIDKAFELFDKYNFSGAVAKLSYLKEIIPEPDDRQQLNFVYRLAKCYEAWDSLDFLTAAREADILREEIKRDSRRHPKFILMDFKEKIEAQAEMLSRLSCIPVLLSERKNAEILENGNIDYSAESEHDLKCVQSSQVFVWSSLIRRSAQSLNPLN